MRLFYCITIPAGIGLATISWPPSGFQEDRQCLPVGDLRPGLELGQGAAADRMLDLEEGVVRQAQDTCDGLGRHLARDGAQDHCPLAELLEADAVVQTAR